MRTDDARLARKVTIHAERVYVGELLKTLSRQAQIGLEADPDDGASDERITVCVKDVPVGEVMDGLYGLFSYNESRWHWTRTKDEQGSFRYRLIRGNARSFASKIKEDVLTELEETLELAIANLDSDKETVATLAKDHPDLSQYQGDRERRKLRAVASLLSKEERARLLRQDEQIEIPYSNLPKPAVDYIQSELELFRSRNPDFKVADPTEVWLRPSQIRSELLPTVFIEAPNSYGGYGFVGGTRAEERWQAKLQDMWFVPGDKKEAPEKESQIVPVKKPGTDVPAKAGGKKKRFEANDLHTQVIQVSEALNIPLIAKLPIEAAPIPPVASGASLSAHLKQWLSVREMRHKWRGGVLLLTYHAWIQADSDATQIPYRVYEKIATDAAESESHILPLQDLFYLADRLSSKQVSAWRLQDDDFLYGTSVLMCVAENLPEFAAMFRSQKLREKSMTEQGAALSYFPQEVAEALRKEAEGGGTKPNQARRFRFSVKEEKKIVPLDPFHTPEGVKPEVVPCVIRTITMEILGGKGEVLVQRQTSYNSQFPRPKSL